MSKELINTSKAPAAVGPYSQGIRSGDTCYFSGQIGLVPETGKMVEGDVAAQAEQALKNLSAALAEAPCALASRSRATASISLMRFSWFTREAPGS